MAAKVLRPHQAQIIELIKDAIRDGHRHILVGAPTGFGKTLIAKTITDGAVDKGNRVLFTAHRKELIYQTFDTFERPGAISVSMGSEGAYDKSLPIQIGTLQTIAARIRAKGAGYLGEINLVMMDEIHYGFNSAMQKEIMKTYGGDAIILGLSATPIDSLGYRLEGFDITLYPTQVEDLIALGYLVPVECYAPMKPDLTAVRIQAGDYALDDLEKVMDNNALVSNLYDIWRKYAEFKKTIIFGVSISHVENIVQEFLDNGIAAAAIHSKIHKDERDETLAKLTTGAIQVVVNCEVLTTGFDCPSLECLVMARPTKSIRLAMQCWGRVLRTNPGKEQALIIDTAGAIQDTGYPTARRNFNREKPPKGKKRKKIEVPEAPECDSCGRVVDPMKRGKRVTETDTAIETIFTCPYCNANMSVNVLDKQAKELERVEEARVELDAKTIHYKNMTNQYGGYKELQKIAKKAGYKPGFAWVNSQAITKHNLWQQAAGIFMRADGMGLPPSSAISEIRELIAIKEATAGASKS